MSTATIEAEAPTNAEPQIQQPSDVAGVLTGEIVLRGKVPGGHLAIDPTQTKFNAAQSNALEAIKIDRSFPPAQVFAFLHLCQARDLDPWAKEAYLIKRGKGNNTTYTMQTGIDGYLKLANDTGRFIRVVGTYWTGNDDDEKSWRWDPEEEVMRRIWFDQWPTSRGYPGAARAVIEYLDSATKSVVRSDGIAHWDMYAPYNGKWGDGLNGRMKILGPDGKQIMELAEMWAKGSHHMIGKCSRALALRTAFPRQTSGIYTHEEMHALDAADRIEQQEEQQSARRAAYAAAQARRAGKKTEPPAAMQKVQSERVDQAVPEQREAGEPEKVGDVVQEIVDAARPAGMPVEAPGPEDVSVGPLTFEPEPEPEFNEDGPEPVELYLAELTAFAGLYDKTLPEYLSRTLAAKGVETPEELPGDVLGSLVASSRDYVVRRLSDQNRKQESARVANMEWFHQMTADG